MGWLRTITWSVGPLGIAATHLALQHAHPIARMCALIGAMFWWMKALVLVENRLAGNAPLPLPTALAWVFLWPGMRPRRALRGSRSGRVAQPLRAGSVRLAAGATLIIGAIALRDLTGNHWIATAPFLVGFSLGLHYGAFELLRAAWNAGGSDMRPLFRNPFAARSLDDFWTRRWNIAYTEMCQETVLRVMRSSGRTARIMAVFLFSALLHEVAISLPVRSWLGGPTLYFVLNGAAMLVERGRLQPGSVAARAWTWLWVLGPLPILFHPPFIEAVVWGGLNRPPLAP